jgi:hypothetical protein
VAGEDVDDWVAGLVVPPGWVVVKREDLDLAATLIDLAKHDLPPHIPESEQVRLYLTFRGLDGQEDTDG